MPEGDTVFLAVTRLRAALEGKTIVSSDLRVPAFATTDLSGRKVVSVEARGKHMLFRFEGGVTLHSHFKMEGTWHIYRPGERWKGPDHQVRAVLETSDAVVVGFRLGITELIETAAEHRVVGHLGPDPYRSDWDVGTVVEALAARPDDAIGDAILDQSVMAGPGNVYRCEVCFLRGVHPSTPVRHVPNLEGFVRLLARLMLANRETGMQITTGDSRPGRTQWVYGRKGAPCRRCSTLIERVAPPTAVDRVTYFCPACQPVRAYDGATTKGSA